MAKKVATPELPIKIIKVSTGPSLSNRAELVYHVGSNAESEPYIRAVQSSGNGQFNADWVSLAVIERLIQDHPVDKPMSARVLSPVYAGRSSNSCGFLFACCLAEGLVKVGTGKDSGYLLGDIGAFKKSVSTLIASGTDMEVVSDAPPEIPKKKRPAKETAITAPESA